MSNEQATDEELDAEMTALMEKEYAEKAAARTSEPEPQTPAEPVPDAIPTPENDPAPVAPQAPATPDASDPKEWAKKKGLNPERPEDALRALQKLEEEFHRRNQAGHPGYRDIQNGNPAPVPPPPPQNWTPTPQAPAYGYPPAPGYGYPPPPPNRQEATNNLAKKYGMDPEDIERLMPMVVDAAEAIASRRTSHLERALSDVTRQSARNSEFNQLVQDPAFMDPRTQQEMHEVFKSDPSLFERPGAYSIALNKAVMNLYRKQLQQGNTPEVHPSNMPPVTAGGGNGSANTTPIKVTPEMAAGWTDVEFDAYMKSNGRVIPKR